MPREFMYVYTYMKSSNWRKWEKYHPRAYVTSKRVTSSGLEPRKSGDVTVTRRGDGYLSVVTRIDYCPLLCCTTRQTNSTPFFSNVTASLLMKRKRQTDNTRADERHFILFTLRAHVNNKQKSHNRKFWKNKCDPSINPNQFAQQSRSRVSQIIT